MIATLVSLASILGLGTNSVVILGMLLYDLRESIVTGKSDSLDGILESYWNFWHKGGGELNGCALAVYVYR